MALLGAYGNWAPPEAAPAGVRPWPAATEPRRALRPLGEASLPWRLLPVWVICFLALDRLRAWRGPGARRLVAPEVLEGVAACALYFISGPGLIILNKYILRDLDFPYPILVSNFGSVAIALASGGLVLSGAWPLERKTLSTSEYARVVLPVAAFTSLSLVLGNWAYLYLSIPLIQILKSFTMVLVMVLGFLMGIESFSWIVVLAVGLMVVGLCISIGSDRSFLEEHAVAGAHFGVGLCVMLSANAAEALRSVFTQVSVERLAFLDSLFWCSPAMVAVGTLLSLVLEGRNIAAASPSWPLAAACLGSAVLGGLVTFSNFWLMRIVSSLTMKVLVNARNIGLVLFAAVALGEPCSAMQYVGYSTSLVGLVAYDRARQWHDQADGPALPMGPRTWLLTGKATTTAGATA